MKTLIILLTMTLQMQVDSLCDLAYGQEEEGNFAEAIRLYEEALEITPADSVEWISIICNAISMEYFCTGDYESAAEYGYRGLQADEVREDSVGLSSSYNMLSAIMLQMGQDEQAIAMAEKAVDIETGLLSSGSEGDRRIVLSDRLGVLSEVLSKTKQYERAIECSLRAIELAKEVGHGGKLGIRLSQLGTIYTNTKDYQQALPLLEQALTLLHEYGQVRSEILTLIPYSQALDETGHRHEAIEAMKQCLSLTYPTGLRETRLHALHELALMHQTADSRTYFDHFTTLRDSIYNDRMQEQISNWEVKYETEKKEQELREQEIRMRHQRSMLIALILLAIILLLAVLGIVKYARTQRRIAEEKNRMVSILSHDLKSPAIAQQRVLRQLEQGHIAAEKSILHALVEAQNAQVDLVLNMLDYARLEAGKVIPQPIRMDLTQVAKDVLNLHTQQAEDKEIKLTIKGDQQYIVADRTMVTTIMRNLVSNAIKFSPRGAEVTIEIIPSGFAVQDHGNGFDTSSSEKGTGLGLIICRRFAKLCHATLTITSSVNEGSKILVKFRENR